MSGAAVAAAPARLRYGLLVDAPQLVAWQAAVLDELAASNAAELALVVVVEGAGARGERARSPASRIAGDALRLFERRLSRARALRPTGRAAAPDGVPTMTVRAVRAAGDRFALRDADVAAIATRDLDLALWLGAGTPTAGVLTVASHGAWAFCHAQRAGGGAGATGFWELVDELPVVGARLCRLAADGEGASTLRHGWFATAPGSYARTRDRVLFGAAAWPALACRDLLRGAGAAGLPGQSAEPEGPDHPAAPPARSTRPRHVVRFLALAARARLRAAWHHGLRHDDWNIGVVDAPIASFLASDAPPDIAWAPTARGRYAADPFALDQGAALQVHYEDYLHARGTASIARRQWSREAGWGRPAPALRIGSHLSYPMLVENEGRYLMLPESRASGNLVLYASDSLDGPWLPAATLDVDGAVGDATLLRHEDRWWLFAVGPSRLNPFTELHLWFADRPEGPWREHPRNPVVVDPRSARPAGRPFVVEGRLYRPGQDCSTGYGRRVTIKRIVALTTEDYREELAAVVRPDPAGAFPNGLHTLTGVGDVTLVDGKRYVWNTAALVRTLRGRLRR